MYQIYVGLFTEGSTDIRFLEPIVEKTFLQIAELQSSVDIEITVQPIIIDKKGKKFIDQILEALTTGFDQYGISILCVQADADDKKLDTTYRNKINKVLDLLTNSEIKCKNIVAIVPIQETESWMLADKELLKIQIGTIKPDAELGIHREPEKIANPKEVIESAIRIARIDLPKKRRHELRFDELYALMGQSIKLSKLDNLSSFQDFKQNIVSTYKQMGIIK
ncbi:MAG: DUF4276 family protein [Saprospiraceae bacterium]